MKPLSKQLLASARELELAQLEEVLEGGLQTVQVLELNLSGAQPDNKPMEINFPFSSIWFKDGSDSIANIRMRPGTRSDLQPTIRLNRNDSFDMGIRMPAYLSWDAQPGKTATIYLATYGKFISGSQVSISAGGVSINEGSSAALGSVTMAASTPIAIAPTKLDRKTAILQNNTTADIYVGADGSVTTATGIRVGAGAQFTWRNTAALWAITTGTGPVVRLEEA